MNEADNISQSNTDGNVDDGVDHSVDDSMDGNGSGNFIDNSAKTKNGESSDLAISVEFSVRLDELSVDESSLELPLLRRAVVIICRDAGIVEGEISVAIVGNKEMRELHRQFLGVDETTDVMSFPLERNEQRLVADIVVCQKVAEENSRDFGCTPFQELLLYVIHGILHLVGFDDTTDATFQQMSAAEVDYMHRFGFKVAARDHSAHPEDDAS